MYIFGRKEISTTFPEKNRTKEEEERRRRRRGKFREIISSIGDSLEGYILSRAFPGNTRQGHALFELCFIESLRAPPLLSPHPRRSTFASRPTLYIGVEASKPRPLLPLLFSPTTGCQTEQFTRKWKMFIQRRGTRKRSGSPSNKETRTCEHVSTFQIFICLSNYS